MTWLFGRNIENAPPNPTWQARSRSTAIALTTEKHLKVFFDVDEEEDDIIMSESRIRRRQNMTMTLIGQRQETMYHREKHEDERIYHYLNTALNPSSSVTIPMEKRLEEAEAILLKMIIVRERVRGGVCLAREATVGSSLLLGCGMCSLQVVEFVKGSEFVVLRRHWKIRFDWWSNFWNVKHQLKIRIKSILTNEVLDSPAEQESV